MITNQGEQQIINKLKAQRANVRPSRTLLEQILSQLSTPASPQSFNFGWLRIAIPASVAVLIGIVFSQTQEEPGQIAQAPPEISQLQAIDETAVLQPTQVLSAASLEKEEETIEQVFTQQEEFFEDTLPIAEEKSAAFGLTETKPSVPDARKDALLEQIELFEQRVLEKVSSRAALIQTNLEELSSAGTNTQEPKALLADAQTKILQVSGILESLKENVRSKEINDTAMSEVRSTLKTATNTMRDVYKIFRAITKQTND